MTFDLLQQIVREQRAAGASRILVPVARRISADLITPVSAFLTLRQGARHPFLLESVEGGERLARYSFIGRNPYRVVEARNGVVEIDENGVIEQRFESIFDVLRGYLTSHVEVTDPELPRFTGGAVGFFAYDVVRHIEHLPGAPPDDLGVPDARWCFYRTVVAFDHVRLQVVLMTHLFIEPDTDLEAAYESALTELETLAAQLSAPCPVPPDRVVLDGQAQRSNVEPAAFEAAVERAKHHIREGDIFQVVLSQRFETTFSGDAFNLYRALRQVNPSPYLFYLELGDFTLVGSSPEVLVRVEAGTAELLPIAGTRPRGTTPEADAAHEADLVADPKEQAEHLMLVDLGRNDLGRVCTFGSVAVNRYAYVERYSHVMHLVSTLSGQVRPDLHAVDVLKACFPAGTLSGAPKVRAMEIIDQLEPNRRGIYGGAVGYFDFSGNMDTCIAIRTMLVRGDRIFVQAGAGVVADSNPTAEYEETVNKARALRTAIELAASSIF